MKEDQMDQDKNLGGNDKMTCNRRIARLIEALGEAGFVLVDMNRTADTEPTGMVLRVVDENETKDLLVKLNPA